MSKEAMKLALETAYLAGFNASGEGYNGEYPFGDRNQNPEEDTVWIKDRDNALREALAEQPAQKRPQNCGTGYCSCIECVMEPEQPAQQEPVDSTQISKVWWDGEKLMAKPIPFVEFYKPAQRTWVGLTDEEIKKLAAPLFMTHYWKLCNEFARAIEAAHDIKENT